MFILKKSIYFQLINIFHHGELLIINRAVKFRKSKWVKFYNIYEEQRREKKTSKEIFRNMGEIMQT